MEATKRPWKVNTGKSYPLIVDSEKSSVGGDGLYVGEIWGEKEVALANAKLIVKAVNNYDELVRACIHAKALIASIKPDGLFWDLETKNNTLQELHSVLSKLEGEL